jgi:hypothetical protein
MLPLPPMMMAPAFQAPPARGTQQPTRAGSAAAAAVQDPDVACTLQMSPLVAARGGDQGPVAAAARADDLMMRSKTVTELPDGLVIFGDTDSRRLDALGEVGEVDVQQKPEPAAWCCSWPRGRGGCLDSSFMLLMLLAGLATMGLSLYKAFGASRGTPLEDTMLAEPYTLIPFLWGLINTVPPILYIHYTAVNGSSLGLKWTCSMLRVVAMAAGLAALGLIWLSLPAEVGLASALAKGLGFISAQKAGGMQVGIRCRCHRHSCCQQIGRLHRPIRR